MEANRVSVSRISRRWFSEQCSWHGLYKWQCCFWHFRRRYGTHLQQLGASPPALFTCARFTQESGDSVSCGIEFETAIQILNGLSDYSSIDSSKEYLDLSKSLIEDYEKYIAQIDSLGPNASVYALREKLNQVVEQGDITGLKIPRIEIKGTQVPLPLNEYVERATGIFMGRAGIIWSAGSIFPENIFRWWSAFSKRKELQKNWQFFRCRRVVCAPMQDRGHVPLDCGSLWKAPVRFMDCVWTGGLMKGKDFEKSTRAAARHLKDL